MNVDFELVEHGGMNIKVEGNSPMEEDDPKVENTIEDVGIGAADNVLENRIEEDVTGTTDEDDDSGASNNDDKEILDIPVIEEDSETCSRSTKERETRGQKIRRKFNKHIQFYPSQGWPCSYDDETKGDIKVPLRYIHLDKEWVPKELPPINTNFCVNERIYHKDPSSLHGLGLFSMDGIKVSYKKVVELMEYVGPCYNYKLDMDCAI